jgi:hypothetical protein
MEWVRKARSASKMGLIAYETPSTKRCAGEAEFVNG